MADLIAHLKASKARLEKGWCQNSYALDANGKSVMPTEKDAVSWDLLGSLLSNTLSQDSYVKILRTMMKAMNYAVDDRFHLLMVWADHPERQKQEVIELMNKTIQLMEISNG
jgi:hypothetical protein